MIRRSGLIATSAACIAVAIAFGGVALGSSSAAGKKQAQVAETVTLPGLHGNPSPQKPAPTGTATSTCPKGTKLGLGGFTGAGGPDNTQPGITVTGLQRPSKRTWGVTASNLNGGDGNLTSLAYCSKVKKLKESRSTASVPQFGTGTATATCPKKTSVRLGGLSTQLDPTDLNPAVAPTGMQLASKRTLQVSAVNVGEQGAGTVEAIAYCGKGPKLKTATATASVPHAQTLGATAQCPKKKPVVFGGFNVEIDLTDFDPILVLEGLERPSKRTWTASAVGLGEMDAGPGTVTSYAYCGKKKK
jgi:hypothetical protein